LAFSSDLEHGVIIGVINRTLDLYTVIIVDSNAALQQEG
jgi:hypothetical protein